MPVLYCPRCGSDRVGRLPSNPVSPFRGYRCGACGRRLRDRWSGPVYGALLALVAGVAGTAITTARPAAGARADGEGWNVYQVLVGAALVAVAGYAVVELTRPTPRTRPPTPPPTPAGSATPESGEWYYARGGARVGPFGFDQLRQLAAAGAVTPGDMVLDPGGRGWVSAGTIVGLFDLAAGAVPAFHAEAGSAPEAAAPPGRGRRVAFGAAAVVVGGLGLALAVRGSGAGNAGGPLPAPAGVPPAPPPPAVERLTVGPGRDILYAAGLGADAERLGRALGEVGYGEGKWPSRVQLARRGDAWVVELDMRPAVFDDPTTPAAMERWVGVRVAASAFPGGRVEVRLGETGGRERVAFRVEGAGRSPIGGSAAAVYSLGGAKVEGDRLADRLARDGLDTRIGWVILLAREPGGWVMTPLNLRPEELVPGVRRRWAGLARGAAAAFAAPVRVEVLGDDYRPATSLTAADETDRPG